MTLDTTFPLWGLAIFLIPQCGLLIWFFISLHFRAKDLEKSLERAQEDIKKLEKEIDTEIKTIHQSIGEINSGLKQLNNYITLILDGRIKTDAQNPIK